jgi:hypothetical protein
MTIARRERLDQILRERIVDGGEGCQPGLKQRVEQVREAIDIGICVPLPLRCLFCVLGYKDSIPKGCGDPFAEQGEGDASEGG